jgi:hypothetical protein
VDVHVARILGALEWSVYKSTVMAPNQEEVIRACAEAILSPRDWVSVNNTCGALGQLLRDDQEDFLALRKIYLEYQKEQA